MSNLFSPITVGPLTLPNRILMAPLTRCRADADHVPGPLIAEHYQGVIIGNMGYQAAEANAAIEAGLVDAVAFGTGFLANPDLPARIKAGAPLNAPNPATFYSPGPEGYTDYPFLS